MGLRTQLIKCSNCGRQLEDTGADEYICHYCGKKTFRDLAADRELLEQRIMVIRLNADVKWQKTVSKVLIALGMVIMAFSMLFHFAEKFLPEVLYSSLGVLALGALILAMGTLIRKRYRHNNNKLQDLTGGRGFIGLK